MTRPATTWPATTRPASARRARPAGRGGRLLRWARGGLVVAALAGGLSPSDARAAAKEIDPAEAPDGRLEGYATSVAYEKSSTVLTWFLFFFLLLVGMTALFKTAKRE